MKKIYRIITLALGIILASYVAGSGIPAQAETTGALASGANNASLTITLSDSTLDFGDSLDPKGTDSNSTDNVADYQGSSGNEGTYYVWISNAVAVSSNKAWNGIVTATENTGAEASATMAIASGVFKYVEGTDPQSYGACSAGSDPSSTPGSWKSNIAPGRSLYTHHYCLRVDWDDAPGTFVTALNYTATQS